jgi:DNA-binding LacI/PurR family transcriptional regulator/DNA-binding transcriptional regulator YhcF (GntR family)
MPLIRILSAVDQVAGYLREELLRGQWSRHLPGVDRLAPELGVSRKTLEAALRQLEADGLLTRNGPRRKRSIELREDQVRPALRVSILLSDAADRQLSYLVDLQHELARVGHQASFAEVTMSDCGMAPGRIARMIERTPADAWVATAAPRELLRWFHEKSLPVCALFGRRRGLPIAGVGPNKPPAYGLATRKLIALGHRRIVLIARRMRRLPEPGSSERAFLTELAAHGIPRGSYHLPDWEESVDGFHAGLESLFRMTPPTALIIQEAALFAAAQQFLARRGLRVPEDVSLICTDADPTFAWYKPSVAHIRWDSRPVVRRIVRWAANIGSGKPDVRQVLTPAEFVPGGTIGPEAVARGG